GLLYERAQVHHVVGHRWFLESGWLSQSKPYRRIIGDHPQSRSLATALLRARFASGFANQLHHSSGHDPFSVLCASC
ncbi:hypothetical protein, partial [Bradyrhizobium vignae]